MRIFNAFSISFNIKFCFIDIYANKLFTNFMTNFDFH